MIIILINFLQLSVARTPTDYAIKLENWNSGRVYISEMQNDHPGKFGPICIGNRSGKMSIRGKYGETFGKMVCTKLGFGPDAAAFVGNRGDYHKFMKISVKTGEECVPNTVLFGLKCREHKKCSGKKVCSTQFGCRMRDNSHPKCTKGQSDVFVHCAASGVENSGTWSDWHEPGTCSTADHFRQRHRTCVPINKQNSNPVFCPGPWLEVSTKINSCKKTH